MSTSPERPLRRVTVTFVFPADTPVTFPLESTVATRGFADAKDETSSPAATPTLIFLDSPVFSVMESLANRIIGSITLRVMPPPELAP